MVDTKRWRMVRIASRSNVKSGKLTSILQIARNCSDNFFCKPLSDDRNQRFDLARIIQTELLAGARLGISGKNVCRG
jgi:hypothetical protein